MEVSRKNRKKLLLQDSYRENKLTVTKEEEGEDKNQDLGLIDMYFYIYIYIYKVDKQQGPTAQHREQYSCLVITIMEKNLTKNIYIKLNHFI